MTTEKEIMYCDRCGEEIVSDGFLTGYGVTKSGEKHCYKCCGEEDAKRLENLKPKEKMVMYWTDDNKTVNGGVIINWPGTLKIRFYASKVGRHNFTGIRKDCWFTFRGNNYHAVKYGSDFNGEYCYVNKVK